jgi:hypothetical protein
MQRQHHGNEQGDEMKKYPVSILVAFALLFAAALGSHMNAQNPAGGYTSPAQGGTSANAIVNNPLGTSQTITPGDTTSVPLTIVGAASTSVDLFDVGPNGGTKAFSVNNTGTTFQIGAGVSGATINCSPGGGVCTFGPGVNAALILGGGGAGPVNLKTSGSIGLGVGIGSTGLHLNLNAANEDIAGKLTCAGSTATKTFSTAFTSTPTVIVFDETTKGGANLTAISNSAFTVSCTGATDALDYIVVGNPN